MRVYWSRIPLFRCLLPFITGIALQHFLRFSSLGNEAILIAFIGCSLLTAIFYFTKTYAQRYYFGVAMQAVFLLFGYAYSSQFHKIQFDQGILNQQKLPWVGKIDQLNYKSGLLKSIDVDILFIYNDAKWQRNKLKVRMWNSKHQLDLQMDDYLYGRSIFTLPQLPLNPTQFNYANYLENQGIAYVLTKNTVLYHKRNYDFLSKLDLFRKHLVDGFISKGIVGQELSVLSALILGDKSGLDREVRSNYAVAGVMHVLAVSGLHVGIVYLLLGQFLNLFSKKLMPAWLKLIVLILSIWGFAALTGFSPSVQRAAFMFSFILVSEFKNRRSNIINSICGSALLLILINPMVIFNIGFQLSYSAVIGIVLFYPKFYPLLYFKYKLMDKAWSLVVVSFSAQLATLPITLLYFHQFPTYFLVSNILVIPLAFLIVFFSLIFSFTWVVFNHSMFIEFPLDLLLKGLNATVEFVHGLPFSSIKDIWIHEIESIVILLIIFFVGHYLYFRRYFAIVCSLVLVVSCLTFELVNELTLFKKHSIRFYAVEPQCLVFTSSMNAEVIYNEDTLDGYAKELIDGHLTSEGFNHISWRSLKKNAPKQMATVERLDELNLYAFRDWRIAQVTTNDLFNCTDLLHNIDVLLISKGVFLENTIDFDKIPAYPIFDSSIPKWSKFHEEFALEQNVHFINKKGYLEFTVD